MNVTEEIKELKDLLDSEAITQEEFDERKQRLLNQDTQPTVVQATPVEYEKNKLVAGLLAIFLGTLGIHKFYLGYSKEAVIMLLVSILGSLLFFIGPVVMGIIALIEGIMYLTKTDAAFDAMYVQEHKGWF